MSQGPETKYYRSIHKLLPPSVYRVKMSNPYVGGIPDCWYSGSAGDLWVEYKWGSNGLSALQKDWIGKRRAEGRKVWVIVGDKEGGWLFDGHTGVHYTKAEIVKLIAEVTIGKKTKGNSRRK